MTVLFASFSPSPLPFLDPGSSVLALHVLLSIVPSLSERRKEESKGVEGRRGRGQGGGEDEEGAAQGRKKRLLADLIRYFFMLEMKKRREEGRREGWEGDLAQGVVNHLQLRPVLGHLLLQLLHALGRRHGGKETKRE